MMAMSMELEQTPQWWSLSAEGVLDYAESSAFRLSVHRILKSSPNAAIVDLSGLSYIDSAGLGILLAMSKEYGAMGRQLILITNENVDKILRQLRVEQLFATASSLADAVELIETKSAPTAATAATQ